MELKKPKNDNYAAVVVEIKTLLPLDNCDNVQAAIIMGNQVIVGKNIKIGDVGLYFPLETQLSETYLKNNNLYRKPELNIDPKQKGYFEENGRIRCVKFRGHKSEGLFMPTGSLVFLGTVGLNLQIGDTFDELEGIEICRKYVVNKQNTPGQPGSKKSKDRKLKRFKSKLIEDQFRFHQATSMLYKNLHRINPDSLISITYKLHGTSGISSYVLCKKEHSKIDKFKGWLWDLSYKVGNLFRSSKYSFSLVGEKYDYLFASRKVIKNEEINPNAEHYYDDNIWALADTELKPFLSKGMTFYYEIVGFLPNGGAIQKDYDYGCVNPLELWERDFIIKDQGESKYLNCYLEGRNDKKSFGIYIYRITQTNVDGKVFEFSAKQVQDFCKKNGLNAVPVLYYGYAKDFADNVNFSFAENSFGETEMLCKVKEDFNHDKFLERVKILYNEHDCYICVNKVPEEGVVVRIEGLEFEAYKQKSNRFYERETKLLDSGEENIEDDN